MLQTVITAQCDDIQEAAEDNINGKGDHYKLMTRKQHVTEEYSVEKVVEQKNEEGNYMLFMER